MEMQETNVTTEMSKTTVTPVSSPEPAGQKARKKSGIKMQLVLQTVVPALVIAVGLTVFARSSLISGLESEALSGLKMLATATMAGYSNMDGDYRVEGDVFYKGETDLTAEMAELDNYVSDSDAAVTVCFGPTRVMTTLTDASGQRIVGTNVSDAVWATVQRGEVYETTHITINNADYAACYVPLKNPDGSIVGIVFAGQPRAEIDGFINSKVSSIIVLAVVMSVIFVGVGYLLANRIANCLIRTKTGLESLATGNLSTKVEASILKRNDELGAMGDALNGLIAKLRDIVGNLLESSGKLNEAGQSMDEMASQCSNATDEISRAVDEISRGAVSQAEEIEHASGQIVDMGNQIESIVECVGRQTSVSVSMSNAGSASLQTMHELSDSNDKTVAALNSIAQQIQLTNESVQKIGAATDLITSIASQTSLLSLNASIEAARAGESGKGFSVVAMEIRNLADQSMKAGTVVREIVGGIQESNRIATDAAKATEEFLRGQTEMLQDTVSTFGNINASVMMLVEALDATRQKMKNMQANKSAVNSSIEEIYQLSGKIASAIEEMSGVVCEKMVEIDTLADTVRTLNTEAEELQESMSRFVLEESMDGE